MNDFIEFMLFVFFVMLLVLGAVGLVGYVVVSHSCSAYEQTTQRPTKMAGGECYVQHGSQWFHWDEWKLRNATAGAKQ